MRFGLLTVLIFSLLISFTACSSSTSDTVVAEYGDYKITLNEFEKEFAKNVGGIENAEKASLEEKKNFLDLYLNFKMKLRDSEVRRFDQNPELVDELNDYKRKVGVSYIKEKLIIEPSLKDFYNKRLYELRVSHIMIRPDTLSDEEAKSLATEIIKRVQNGESYEELAKEYSADQFSRNKGGDIYYITAGQIIPEFEDAAYKTPVGEVYPEPVKTQYGYHIIKVTDKHKRIKKVKASHILIDSKTVDGKPDSVGALALAKEIRQRAVDGEDFGKLAEEYSIDKGSAQKGGDLGYFERRMMVPEFDEAAFNLKVGEISDIVKTQFGYHIIKLTEINEVPPFEEEKNDIRTMYDKTRLKKDVDTFIDSLKNAYSFKLHEETIKSISAANDSSVKMDDKYWTSTYRDNVKDSVIFSISKDGFVLDSLMAFIKSDNSFKFKIINESSIKEAAAKYSEELLLEKEALRLDETNDEFADLMDDYKNGIYIFKLQEEEVWDRVSVDTTKLYGFYQETKDNYNWPNRVDFSEIYVKNDSLSNNIYSKLEKGEDFSELAKSNTQRGGMGNKEGAYGIVKVEDNELAEKAFELSADGDFSKPFKYQNGWSIVKLNKKLPAGPKTFEEAKAEVASAYQERMSKKLEDEYIARLKSIYEPEKYYDKLEKAFEPALN